MRATHSLLLLLVLAQAPALARELPLAAQAQFKIYSIAEGLSQKTVSGVAQDPDGFLWIATFGGLNRFDGRTFETFTTDDGLRQNLIQAVMADAEGRVWAGDSAGGLTLLEGSRVTRTFAPDESVRGIARALVTIGDSLYFGTQPGGLRHLDLQDMDAGFSPVVGAPDQIIAMATSASDVLYLLTPDSFYRYRPDRAEHFELLVQGASSLASDGDGQIAVGHRDGRIARLDPQGELAWDQVTYGARVSGLALRDGEVKWVFLDGKGMVPYGEPDAEPMLRTSGDAPAVNTAATLYDQEGVLWVPIRSGLARYLGGRFKHFPLEVDGVSPEVFSILPDNEGTYWFGTSHGLLAVRPNGSMINVSDRLGIPRREVRTLAFSRDQRTLWMGQVNGPAYGADVEAFTIVATLGDEKTVVPRAVVDANDRVWLGEYQGRLLRRDPLSGEVTIYELPKGAAVYAMDIADDDVLWFAGNYEGLYRLDLRDPQGKPEQVASFDDLEQDFFLDLVAEGAGDDTAVWLSGVQGAIYRFDQAGIARVAEQSRFRGHTLYAVQPLADGTVVLAAGRGVYRYDPNSDLLDHYSTLDGFVAIETKAHAKRMIDANTLLIGTTSGVTRMDLSLAMDGASMPRPLFVERTIGGVQADDMVASRGRARNAIRVRYTAVSTRKPAGVEYSYKLDGDDEGWSAPTTTTSNTYSSLDPGEYVFRVRARVPEGKWSTSADWSFSVPTPYWRSWWFMALVLLAASVAVYTAVGLRLRSSARANQRLRDLVAERTASIEASKRDLEAANGKLSAEMLERLKADERREEVETRFQQAYQSSPLGMALVDGNGVIYDVNPKMKSLFWPSADEVINAPLLDIVIGDDRNQLREFLARFATEQAPSPNLEVRCRGFNGDVRRIDFHPAAVRNREGQLNYLVVLANDVTESRAMTDQLAYQASFDELTGLLNRRAFADILKEAANAAANGNTAFLMFMDLDQFKVVNDTCGHAAGDELLKSIAALIKQSVRQHDAVARLGGDEFAVIVMGGSQEIALRRAESLREQVRDLTFRWEQESFRVGISIGVVPVGDSDRSLDELQQLADAACFAAKHAGRNRVHFVAGEDDVAHEHRGEMRWVQRISNAIDEDSFILFGQQIRSLAESRAGYEKVEVLLRMIDKGHDRLIPPGAFLPAAERYGLQDRLDRWVVAHLIQMLQEKPHEYLADRQFWVNLSGASIGDAEMADTLVEMVRTSGLPRGCLNFEITETAVVRKIEDAKRLIATLRKMGCQFALDDFGSGLSSFGYLKHLKVDALKIDGQFVKGVVEDATDRAFVRSLIEIAHTMNMRTVVEFVEDDETLRVVGDLGTDDVQGFGIHRPEPLAQLIGLRTVERAVSQRR